MPEVGREDRSLAVGPLAQLAAVLPRLPYRLAPLGMSELSIDSLASSSPSVVVRIGALSQRALGRNSYCVHTILACRTMRSIDLRGSSQLLTGYHVQVVRVQCAAQTKHPVRGRDHSGDPQCPGMCRHRVCGVQVPSSHASP